MLSDQRESLGTWLYTRTLNTPEGERSLGGSRRSTNRGRRVLGPREHGCSCIHLKTGGDGC